MQLRYHDLVPDAALAIIIISVLWLIFSAKQETTNIVRCNDAKYLLKIYYLPH